MARKRKDSVPVRDMGWAPEEVQEDVVSSVDNSGYNKPDVGSEKKRVRFEKDGYTEDELDANRKDMLEEQEERGYLHIKRVSDIEKVFGTLSIDDSRAVRTGRLFYFVWKYSGWLDLLVKQTEKDDYVRSIGTRNQAVVMQHVADYDLISDTYLMDETRFCQRTDNYGRLHKRGSDGKVKYFRPKNSKTSKPVKRPASIYDVPLTMIKKVMEVEELTAPKKKGAK